MSINVTAKYVIMTIVCMAYIDVKASHVINDIGSQLCPYTSFCQRNATPFFNPLQLRPCCSDCSCEANCWETANCCPDQDVIEHPEPVANCKTSIVKAGKGFSSDIWGYRVIDYCPTTETNASLVTKCTNEKSRDFVDLIRVSDDISRKVYQNRFCAECHHVTNRITELPLVAQCTEDIYTNEGNWKSFLLSNKCQLTSINTNLATCAVPKYTRCNQTGLWQNFDADVKWACEIFEAVFFLKASQGRNEHTDTYRNAYCYVCNTDSIGSIDALCPGRKFQPPGVTVFSSLIDYKRYQTDVQDTTPLTTCRSHEIMDTIMKKCRLLKCSFGSAPVNGKCKPLFERTTGLFIDIPFTLSVIWSRAEYRMTDKTRKLRKLGENIIDHFLNEARLERTESQCPYCYLEIQMAADISKHGVRSVKRNDVNSDVTNTSTDVSENKLEDDANHETKGGVSSVTLENNRHEELEEAIDYTSPAFILKAALFTVAHCQLQNIFDIASDLFGTVINIERQGETELQLKVGLLKDTDVPTNQTFKTLKKEDNDKIQCKVKGAHTLKDEKFCPKIPITYNEFVPHLTRDNSELISSFFQKKHIETGEATEVCVDTYYERLQSIDFQILSQGSVIITDMRLFLLYFIYLFYLYIILRE